MEPHPTPQPHLHSSHTPHSSTPLTAAIPVVQFRVLHFMTSVFTPTQVEPPIHVLVLVCVPFPHVDEQLLQGPQEDQVGTRWKVMINDLINGARWYHTSITVRTKHAQVIN